MSDTPSVDLASVENPLLSIGHAIPFDLIEAEHVEPGIDALIAATQARLDAVGEETAAPTYDNSLGALEAATEPLERAFGVVGHLESVATSEALRAAYNEVKPRVSALFTSIALDERLYRRLRAFSETDEAKTLPPTKKRYLDKELRAFRRSGAELDEAGKTQLRAIDVELSKLTTKFSQNVLDETNAFDLVVDDEAKLAGLPESAVKAARASAEQKGVEGWRFTLHAPSLIAALTYLEDAGIRETLWRAYNTRATAGERNNGPLIARILKLRRDKAKLLGYATFADFVLEERMAKTGGDARAFVDDLGAKTTPFFAKENEALNAFRTETEGADAPAISPWDVGFYSERLRKARYDFDDEQLRPYFVADRVLGGLFSVVERLYGMTVESEPDASGWHEDVQVYRMRDGEGVERGTFYIDLYPRDDKRGGAWMNSFITGGPTADGFVPHVGLFCANVTPPVGGEPALLTHREVETLFHEFGHLMHHLLSEVDVRSLAGTSVAWDFVELPSQIMENWTWEREALDLFARHVETDATIPDALFDKMKAARTFRAANGMMRQLGFATADLALHVELDPESDVDPVAFARERMQPFAAVPYPDDYAMICAFTHLFASSVGYAAGYYSYKWAEVLDADAFTRFRDGGVFNAEVGREFREKILSRGDSDDPGALFRDFMGREPQVDALLERSGLSA
ncbi:MAG: M3 family metallopeptidase [Sandaracinaceae bacterium]